MRWTKRTVSQVKRDAPKQQEERTVVIVLGLGSRQHRTGSRQLPSWKVSKLAFVRFRFSDISLVQACEVTALLFLFSTLPPFVGKTVVIDKLRDGGQH